MNNGLFFIVLVFVMVNFNCSNKLERMRVINMEEFLDRNRDGSFDASRLVKEIGKGRELNITIEVPTGTFLLSEKSNNQIVEIARKDHVIIRGKGIENSVIIGDSNDKCETIFSFRDCAKVEIEGILFQGMNRISLDRAPQKNSRNNEISYNIRKALFFHANNLNEVTIENCSFKYFVGIAIHSVHANKKFVVNNCGFYNLMRAVGSSGQSSHVQPTGVLIKNSDNTIISNSTFKNIIDLGKRGLCHSVYLSNVKSGMIDNNVIENDKLYTYTKDASGGVQTQSGNNDRIIVTNNQFSNTTSNFNDGSNYEINNNVWKNSRVNFKDIKGCIFSNNRFLLTVDHLTLEGVFRIMNDVHNMIIKNNLFDKADNFSNTCIAIQIFGDCSNINIDTNTFKNFGFFVYLGNLAREQDIREVNIDNNTFIVNENIGACGVNIRSGIDIEIRNNYIENRGNPKFKWVRNNERHNNQINNLIRLSNNSNVGLSLENILEK